MTNNINAAGRAAANLRNHTRVAIVPLTVDSEATAISAGFAKGPGNTLYGIILDTGISATKLTFQGSDDGITYKKLNYKGAEYSLTVAAGDFVTIDEPLAFLAPNYLKIRLGTSTGATQQAAARTLKAVIGPILN